MSAAAASRAHRGFLVIRGAAGDLDLLSVDPKLSPLVQARPHPELLLFLATAERAVTERMKKLDKTPRRVTP